MTTCAAETSLIVATLRTQPTSALVRCLVGTDRPVRRKADLWVCYRSGTSSILGSAAKRRHPRTHQTDAKNDRQRAWCPIPFVRVWVFFFGFGLVPFLFWTTLFASWGSVGFPSVLCQASTVPFPMTPPYVGRGVIFFLLKPFFTHDSRYAPWLAHTGRE